MRLPRRVERFLHRTFGLRRLPPDHDYWYTNLSWGQTAAGVTVTEESALAFSAVYGCVKRLAESVGSTPLPVYRRTANGREKATNDPVYRLLHDRPNPEMTAKQYKQAVVTAMALWGNSYSFVERSLTGEVVALWPIHPSQIEVNRDGANQLVYKWRPTSGQGRTFRQEDILHPRLFSLDGLVGLSPIAQAREAIALGLAEQEYGARLFSNDARPGGVLEHPGVLDDEIHNRIKRSWEDSHRGVHNAHRVAILEEGMKWAQVGMPAKDAEFLASRKFTVIEVCRYYGMQPHMIQDLERATFSNIEQQGIEFVTYTLMPWTTELEQVFTTKLLANGRYAEFNLAGLLRGDLETRYRAYSIGRQWGWLSVNDIRDMENMNRIEGGNEYMVPMNMVPASSRPAGQTAPAAPGATPTPEDEPAVPAAASARLRLTGGKRP